ncbi:MAG TPA: WYL domain-containing transcriptional regulator [Cyclobacteriaceae bacterium]|nr:WYL domain-containing transcriptional regulator [Cyclobacteriaceae bacterium]
MIKKTDPVRESDASLPLAKLLKLFQLIGILKAGRWTIKQLVDRFDSSKSSMYRYLALLDEAGFCLEKDFHNRYFIITTEDDPMQAQFTVEETAMLRALIQADASHPLKSSVLKKLSLHSELDAMPQLFLKAHLGNLVEQLTQAMRNQHQVMLKKYHSANSSAVRDRLVEPIRFGPDYGSLMALDVEEKTCKLFKLDRIGEVVEKHKTFQHRDLHQPPACDIFGLTGKNLTTVTLHLTARAYLLLREEFPMALPYLSHKENEKYIFSGPVASYAGIGRFVMGLLDEIEIVSPGEFREYVRKKVGGGSIR